MRKICLLACLCLLTALVLTAGAVGQAAAQTHNLGRVLVIYYSYGGSTQLAAEAIATRTGADIYAVKTFEAYDPATLNDEVKRQYAAGELPDLEDLRRFDYAQYDLVFLGAPVWWGQVPPPMQSYLENEYFLGTEVALFCTSNGTPGDFFSLFAQLAQGAEVVSHKDFGRARNVTLVNAVTAWLDELAAAETAEDGGDGNETNP